MSVGLEGREPFLDPAVLEFAAKVNHEPGSKSLLKKVLFKHLDSRLFDRPKTGFNLPVYKWLKTEYWQKKMGELLGFERIKKQGIFDPEYIANLVDRFNAGKYVNPDKLWLLIIFQMWFDKWND